MDLHSNRGAGAAAGRVGEAPPAASWRHIRLAALLIVWLSDAGERSRVGENGRQVVAENRGALAALIEQLEPLLPRARPN